MGRAAADIQSAINRALYCEDITNFRAKELRVAQKVQRFGITNAASISETLLRHRDLAARAARSVDPGISNLEARQAWR